MKRAKPTQDRKPTAILTADWHLREDQPVCRTDNFWEVQWKKASFIKKLKAQFNCPVISSGDTFNHWKPSPFLLTTTMENIPSDFYTVYGNHDLPQWNLSLSYKTGLRSLEKAGYVTILKEASWTQVPDGITEISFKDMLTGELITNSSILLWHVMTFPAGKPPWPGCTDMTAEEILDKYPQFDLIVTGHNHKTFVVEKDVRLLVNPGSLTRQIADQADHHPCVFLWYAKDNIVEKVVIPHQEEGVISREHIAQKEERDERIDRFISQLSSEYRVGLSFEENLERFKQKNDIGQPVMEIIRRAIE
jgi:DNA repair exonuclease SbcCD nuclease subunit